MKYAHCKNGLPPHEAVIPVISERRGSSPGDLAIGSEEHNSENCKGCKIIKSRNQKHVIWTFDKNNEEVICNGYNTDGNVAVNLNPFLRVVQKNNLYKNKHVPRDYIVNSEENRLKIHAWND